jgi:hypothetical protein
VVPFSSSLADAFPFAWPGVLPVLPHVGLIALAGVGVSSRVLADRRTVVGLDLRARGIQKANDTGLRLKETGWDGERMVEGVLGAEPTEDPARLQRLQAGGKAERASSDAGGYLRHDSDPHTENECGERTPGPERNRAGWGLCAEPDRRKEAPNPSW